MESSSDDEDVYRELIQRKRYLLDDKSSGPVPKSTRHSRKNRLDERQHVPDEPAAAPPGGPDKDTAACGSSKDQQQDQTFALGDSAEASSSPSLLNQDELLMDDEQMVLLLEETHRDALSAVNEDTCSEVVPCDESSDPIGSNESDESDGGEGGSVMAGVDENVFTEEGDHDVTKDTGENDVTDDAVGNVADVVKNLLYENSSNTVDEAVLLLMDLYVSNRNVSKKLVGQIASLIHTLLPQPNAFPSSKYLLFKYLKKNAPPKYQAEIYYVCELCEYFKGLKSDVENSKCKACGSEKNFKLIFSPLDQIVKHLFQVRSLAKVLSKPERAEQDCLRDITDGNFYKSFEDKMGPYDITLLWNCDGVSTSGSSGAQLWPLQFTICEVPPVLRKSFLVVCGFFFGSSKPVLNSFLRPFAMSLRKISVEGGVQWTNPITQEQLSSVVRAPFASLDAPARGQALNMTIGGYFACGMCEIRGECVFHKRGNKVVYPTGLKEETLRTAESIREQSLRATRAQPVNGLYGPNVIMCIPRFDPARGVPNEYMHGTCLGAAKTISSAWMDDTRGDWYVPKNRRHQITAFLQNVLPPDTVTRTPRDVKFMPQWKASEWRLWLLFYSPVAMLEVWQVDNKFFQHWILLVKAIYNLLKDEVTRGDIEEAKELLTLFLQQIRRVYSFRDPDPDHPNTIISGDWLYTYNIHQLIHLPDVVQDTGPLQGTAAFVFEDNNGNLSNIIHGTNNADEELINSLEILESVRVLRRKVEGNKLPEGRARSEGVINRIEVDLSEAELGKIRAGAGNVRLEAADCNFFARATSNGQVLASCEWDRAIKRNSYTVRCVSQGSVLYGEIMYFVKIDEKIFFMLRKMQVNHSNMIVHKESRALLKHILPVNVSSEKVVLSLDCIHSKVIRARNYLCIPPNKIEVNLLD